MELKQTMEMYSSACKEALTAKQMVRTGVLERGFYVQIVSIDNI